MIKKIIKKFREGHIDEKMMEVDEAEAEIRIALEQQRDEILEFLKDQKQKKYSTDLIIKHLENGLKAEEI